MSDLAPSPPSSVASRHVHSPECAAESELTSREAPPGELRDGWRKCANVELVAGDGDMPRTSQERR